jgi:hypothetical protein
MRLKRFMKKAGGVNACAAAHAKIQAGQQRTPFIYGRRRLASPAPRRRALVVLLSPET